VVDVSEIKARVTLRELLERDGVSLRRAGTSWVACCPIHNETTPSFHLHEKAGGDWFKCFGCDAKGDVVEYMQLAHGMDFIQAKDALAAIAGLGGSADAIPRPLPKRELPQEGAVVIEALEGDAALKWERACSELYTDGAEVARWAAWRGLRPAVIEWAARRGLCGRVMMYGEWREAFLIRDVAAAAGFEDLGGTCMRNIGFHVRLAPRKEGEKASWRYSNRWVQGERLECEASRGLGAWPFVVLPEGFEREWKYIFCCEGQWDALALIDVMGWETRWPAQVAVFGMRGATSWKRMLDYTMRTDATAFLMADNDEAGMGWFVGEENFADTLRKRVKAVHGYSPLAKDLNDDVRGWDEAGREAFRANLRKRIAKQKGFAKMKPTFLKWLSGEKKKERTDGVVEFARVVTRRGAQVPKGRARKKVWVRFMQAWPEHEGAFFKAWAEWEAIK
jgi:hypothetical protein